MGSGITPPLRPRPLPSTSLFPIFLLSLLLLLAAAALSLPAVADALEDRMNKSSWSALFWSTSKEESDLLLSRAESTDDPSGAAKVGNDDGLEDEFSGGFSSLDSMLQWAIGHSDPAKLKEKASDVQRLSVGELKERQKEIKELMEKLKVPSDAELMQIAIADLNNPSLSLEDRQRALNELLILVEPIDNANDLDKLGGLVAVAKELHNSVPEIRTTSAWILGKASQNNPLVQKQVLSLGALTKLMKMVQSSYMEEAVKALYAISALIRNNDSGQELFYAEAGDLMLQDIMSNSSIDIQLRKKAIFLVADLADWQLENADAVKFPFFSSHLFLKSVVDLTLSSDLDLQEKALLAIKCLLQLGSATEASVFRDLCGLDRALERMRQQLGVLTTQEEQRDFARDMESLRREVEIIFQKKLEKVTTWVPT